MNNENNKYIILKNQLNWRYIKNNETNETYMADGSQIADNYVKEITELLNNQDMEIRKWKSWANYLETSLLAYSNISIIAEKHNIELNKIPELLEKTIQKEEHVK